MKTTLISIILITTLIACHTSFKPDLTEHEMDSVLSDFSVQWKKDSLGLNGFRMNHYSWDGNANVRLINGLNFQGYTELQIIKWLGQPASSERHFEDNCLIMSYPVLRDSKEPDKVLLIYFGQDDKVSGVLEKTGMPK